MSAWERRAGLDLPLDLAYVKGNKIFNVWKLQGEVEHDCVGTLMPPAVQQSGWLESNVETGSQLGCLRFPGYRGH